MMKDNVTIFMKHSLYNTRGIHNTSARQPVDRQEKLCGEEKMLEEQIYRSPCARSLHTDGLRLVAVRTLGMQ